jgi:hypothetical protein
MHFTIPNRDRIGQLLQTVVVENVEVRVNQSAYEDLFGQTFRDQGYQPANRGIVRMSLRDHPNASVVYRRVKAMNGLDADEAIVTWQTLRQIIGSGKETEIGYDVDLVPVSTPIGTHFLFWNHPDDIARVSYKLCLSGILLGLVTAFVI